MTDYRDSAPMFFSGPAKELKGDGKPMFPDKFPDLVEVEPESNQVPTLESEEKR